MPELPINSPTPREYASIIGAGDGMCGPACYLDNPVPFESGYWHGGRAVDARPDAKLAKVAPTKGKQPPFDSHDQGVCTPASDATNTRPHQLGDRNW